MFLAAKEAAVPNDDVDDEADWRWLFNRSPPSEFSRLAFEVNWDARGGIDEGGEIVGIASCALFEAAASEWALNCCATLEQLRLFLAEDLPLLFGDDDC